MTTDTTIPRLPCGALLRVPQLLRELGISRATLYRLRDKGNFPAPYKIGDACVAWKAGDVAQWLESRRLAA